MSGMIPAMLATAHLHSPDRSSHCRARETQASEQSDAVPHASAASSKTHSISSSNRSRNAAGCNQTRQWYSLRVILPSQGELTETETQLCKASMIQKKGLTR